MEAKQRNRCWVREGNRKPEGDLDNKVWAAELCRGLSSKDSRKGEEKGTTKHSTLLYLGVYGRVVLLGIVEFLRALGSQS